LCFGDSDKAPIPVLTGLMFYEPFVPFSIVPLAAVQATVYDKPTLARSFRRWRKRC